LLRHLLDIRIPPNKPSEFDHADVHLKSGRVFVAHTAAGTVEVLDGENKSHLKTISGCPEGSGMWGAQDENIVFAASRSTGRILVIDAISLEAKNDYKVGSRPNGLAWDTKRKQLLVMDVFDSSARLVKISSGEIMATTKLKGRPRWAAFDQEKDRFLVNVRDPPEVAILSASNGEQIDAIPISGKGPHGMAQDENQKRIFVACDSAELISIDSESGREISKVAISGPPDVLWLNAARNLLYCACGEPGAIDVVDTSKLSVIERVKTEAGAHTFTFDTDRQNLYSFYPNSCCAATFSQE
jgi:DNA-binding beta-propeller fold protein YncE